MLLTRPIEVIAQYERFRFPTSSVTDSYAIDKSLGTLREWLKCRILNKIGFVNFYLLTMDGMAYMVMLGFWILLLKYG